MKRVFAIALCVSMVGLTVMPARCMPCCCKGMGKTMETKAMATSICCAPVKTEKTLATSAPMHSCCQMAKSAQLSTCCQVPQSPTPCCQASAVSGPCHGCRCIEQMQVVALSGFAASETVSRIGDAAEPVAQKPCLAEPRCTVSQAAAGDPPGIVITLQTCSLRF